MENPSSPLDTLRQLKEMLDAGALTPTEFEALKQRLVFAPAAPDPAAAAPIAPVAPALPAPEAPTAHPAPALPPASPLSLSNPGQFDSRPAPHREETQARVFEPVPEPLFRTEASADFPVTDGDSGDVAAEMLTDANALDPASPPAAPNSSLGLVLAIAGVLVFLAVVAYLGFTRPASEHISSTSQTAADSVAAPIETGPQVAPLPAITAAPETVRVAPANPAPVLPSRAETGQKAAAARDSAAAVVTPAAPDSTKR
ncbi:SHOCT domain-containing protein [Hymenobacter sp. UYCo722]|uniref:SHOCT domain-containing protein n=1 Tax=Hymenobacter sp. UYCo722 TaxID=3156335 RepID=UPI003390BDCA